LKGAALLVSALSSIEISGRAGLSQNKTQERDARSIKVEQMLKIYWQIA
jgi:hypothetical protein